ncbi:MAG: hypothetical protein ACFE9L_04550 [Candidatus Hodarchaeota archaeon]
MVQQYRLDFDKLKEINFESLGPFLLDRIRKKEILFHFIGSDQDGYTLLAANQEAITYAQDNEFLNVPLKQDKNVKLNEIAIQVLALSRSLLRTPGDEGVLTNNSDLIIDMVLFLKELFVLFGLPVAYWKQFINSTNRKAITQIREIISQTIMTSSKKKG